jgi:hypothetical protein
VTFNFWTGEDNVATSVVSAITGGTGSRNYVGGGTLLEVPPIVDAIGLEARSIEIGLSQIHASVQDMVRAYNIRVATVELHRGICSIRRPGRWSRRRSRGSSGGSTRRRSTRPRSAAKARSRSRRFRT